MEGSEHPLEVKVALSVPEALEIISEHEIGKTVRFTHQPKISGLLVNLNYY